MVDSKTNKVQTSGKLWLNFLQNYPSPIPLEVAGQFLQNISTNIYKLRTAEFEDTYTPQIN